MASSGALNSSQALQCPDPNTQALQSPDPNFQTPQCSDPNTQSLQCPDQISPLISGKWHSIHPSLRSIFENFVNELLSIDPSARNYLYMLECPFGSLNASIASVFPHAPDPDSKHRPDYTQIDIWNPSIRFALETLLPTNGDHLVFDVYSRRVSLYKQDEAGRPIRANGRKVRISPKESYLKDRLLYLYISVTRIILSAWAACGSKEKFLFVFGCNASDFINEILGKHDVYMLNGCKIYRFNLNHPEALRRGDFQPDPEFIRKNVNVLQIAEATANSLGLSKALPFEVESHRMGDLGNDWGIGDSGEGDEEDDDDSTDESIRSEEEDDTSSNSEYSDADPMEYTSNTSEPSDLASGSNLDGPPLKISFDLIGRYLQTRIGGKKGKPMTTATGPNVTDDQDSNDLTFNDDERQIVTLAQAKARKALSKTKQMVRKDPVVVRAMRVEYGKRWGKRFRSQEERAVLSEKTKRVHEEISKDPIRAAKRDAHLRKMREVERTPAKRAAAAQAIRKIHRPKNLELVQEGRRRDRAKRAEKVRKAKGPPKNVKYVQHIKEVNEAIANDPVKAKERQERLLKSSLALANDPAMLPIRRANAQKMNEAKRAREAADGIFRPLKCPVEGCPGTYALGPKENRPAQRLNRHMATSHPDHPFRTAPIAERNKYIADCIAQAEMDRVD